MFDHERVPLPSSGRSDDNRFRFQFMRIEKIDQVLEKAGIAALATVILAILTSRI
ncbi:hypothetical protein FHT82_000937 [Rhizobium sp. BK275]|nr:hypothetical protein [Rhizobium sp. BK275]